MSSLRCSTVQQLRQYADAWKNQGRSCLFFNPVSWTGVGDLARYPFIQISGNEPDL